MEWGRESVARPHAPRPRTARIGPDPHGHPANAGIIDTATGMANAP
jgi:hypothetical protein